MSHEQQKVRMKSAMLTIVAALVFVALVLTGCSDECEANSCTYTGLSTTCCDWLKFPGDSMECQGADDVAALAEGTCS